jgi:hypothetical protein
MALETSKLAAGDVFLYRGSGVLSRLIRFFDGAEVNHAGLYLGNEAVGEALGKGVVQRTLAGSIAGSDRVIARRLQADVAGMDPVLQRAAQILSEGHRYGFEQIALLAFLSLTRRIKAAPILRRLLRRTFDAGATWVLHLASDGRREPMICSEFVFRAYDEALPEPGDAYAIDVDLATPRAGPGLRGPAVPVGRGRGIQPGSLLDTALLPSVRAAGLGARAVAAAPEPEPEPLEALAEQYLREAVDPAVAPATRGAGTLSPADVAAIFPEVVRFAEAWAAATATEAPAVRARGGALDLLARTAADFVTPGDLHHSSSLFTVGDVKP